MIFNTPHIDLKDNFPLYKVEKDRILSREGDITAAFGLQLPEIFTLSAEDYLALHHTWTKAIGVLPVNCVFHKQDWFTRASHQANFAPGQSFLSRSSEGFFHERPYLDHRCHLYITRRPLDKPLGNSAVSNLLRTSLVPTESISEKAWEHFEDALGQFCQILEDGGTELVPISGEEICGSAHRSGVLENYLFLKDAARPELMDIRFKPEWKIGDKYVLMYSMADVEDLPGSVSPDARLERYATDKSDFRSGFAAPIGAMLPCNHIYNQYLFIEDHQKTLKRLESKRLRLESLAAYSRENALSKEATSAFLNEAISEGRKAVKAHFNLMLWTEQKEGLTELRNKASAALAKMDVTPRQETVGAPQLFWAGLPGNQGAFPSNEAFDTFIGPASCFLNLETNYRSSISPVGIRLGDRITGHPVHVDISDEPLRKGYITNRNKFILGPSGSGKSFFTNHMVRHYYEQGTHVVLVDVGHSYRGLCDLVEGYYFTYEENNPIRFNPFVTADGNPPDTEKKESLKTLLLALWKKDDEPFKRSEYVALSNALTGYYEYLQQSPGEVPGFNSFYEYLEVEFREVLQRDGVKDKDFDIENFMYVLRPYYQGGEFDYLLNATENLDLLHQRFIVFELDNIKDHPILFPVVTIIIMEIFIAKMRKLKGVRKMILIEEAWKAIAKEGMAEYIKFLFKTVRKFFGEAIVVTQEVEDIISSPVVKEAIINNSDCKILLDQSKYQNKFERIQELLGLTEKEKAQALSINKANEPGRLYKEVFISLGGQYSRVYRTEVSKAEYLAYTTEESERMQIDTLTRKYGGDRKKAIAVLSREKP
ncbi:TraG family conjugative transposon ATPase [Echinicola vietnamensis]|uniref:Conjugation system ATPase, TraG family n=1 Tax=Echinicola vietnamensis (strain DSM 17526 / LMG 23754 / KMM 6221) TaxID=926556 RepID=L0FZM0_ECHVK|nr:TraG family conjugative transposon ATPase [Echinicola vietnamensis]AGA78201.1 conjugation system ATPase, TraG family [Echinicola vietnamensis DSM 17526]